jgi:hypothetical protein
MVERALVIRSNGDSYATDFSPDQAPELLSRLAFDDAVLGIVFLSRMYEDGPPPAPKDKSLKEVVQ